jgi:large subunit ribosomal protein L10
MARADKAAAVAELATAFRDSQAAVLTEYRGLSVLDLSQLRTALGDNATYSVVKNTLTKIAAREAGSRQPRRPARRARRRSRSSRATPVEAAKGLRDFARTHPLLIIKGGVLDGHGAHAAELTRLADLESREVLLAKLAGAMKASLSGAAALFQAPLAQAARTVEALRAKVEADPSSAPVAESSADDASVETVADSPAEDASDSPSDSPSDTASEQPPRRSLRHPSTCPPRPSPTCRSVTQPAPVTA